MRIGAGVCLILGLGGCSMPDFDCSTHAQCRLDGVQGRCEHSGHCSYPTESCASGFEYHEDAGSDFEGTCVSELIEHFDDGDSFILSVDGRLGQFTAFENASNDAAEDPMLVEDERAGSSLSLRSQGYTDGQAGVAMRVNGNQPYDASQYVGFALWARTVEGSAPRTVELNVITNSTSISSDDCDPCGFHFVTLLPFESEWTRHRVRFTDLVRERTGEQGADASELIGMDFRTTVKGDFAWEIDDVSFLREGR